MSSKKNLDINVETLVLVAVWETPFIFQGCFKITELQGDSTVLYFFRCQSGHAQQSDILNYEFLPEHYEFTHLYNEVGLIELDNLGQVQEDALHLLKYALHVTLKEMLSNRKVHFTAIDDITMHALIDKITPLLKSELSLPEEDHIGFAVAMDFYPKEEITWSAALALLGQLENGNRTFIRNL